METISSNNSVSVQFTDTSFTTATSITYWNWDFGNGQSSTLQSPPIVTYDYGTYDVSLTVSDGVRLVSTTKPQYVQISAPPSVTYDFKYVPAMPPAQRIAFYANGIFLLVNRLDAGSPTFQNGTHSYASSDGGVTWRHGSLPSGLWQSIAFGNGVFVMYDRPAGNLPGTLVTSTDGVNWTIQNSSVLDSVNVLWLGGFKFGNGVFVMVDSGKSATSTDGINWTLHNNSVQSTSLMFGNGTFVTSPLLNGSAHDTVYYSIDGINWSTSTLPYSSNAWVYPIFGNGMFAIPNDTLQGIATSTDGINWTFVPSSIPTSYLYVLGASTGGIFGAGTVVAINMSGNTGYKTSDFITWTPVTIERAAQQWNSVVGSDSGIFILAPRGWDASETGFHIYQ